MPPVGAMRFIECTARINNAKAELDIQQIFISNFYLIKIQYKHLLYKCPSHYAG